MQALRRGLAEVGLRAPAVLAPAGAVGGLRRAHEKLRKTLEPDARENAEEALARQEELARVYRVSERLLRERKLYTGGAQLLQAVGLLRTDAALLERMRAQFR